VIINDHKRVVMRHLAKDVEKIERSTHMSGGIATCDCRFRKEYSTNSKTLRVLVGVVAVRENRSTRRKPPVSIRQVVSGCLKLAAYAAVMIGLLIATLSKWPTSLLVGAAGVVTALLFGWLAVEVKYWTWTHLISRLNELTPLVKEVAYQYAQLRQFELRNFMVSESDVSSVVGWEWWLLKEGQGFTYHFYASLDVNYHDVLFHWAELPLQYGFNITRYSYRGYLSIPEKIDWSRVGPSPVSRHVLTTTSLSGDSLLEAMRQFEEISEMPVAPSV
jgi:hypothetical protein